MTRSLFTEFSQCFHQPSKANKFRAIEQKHTGRWIGHARIWRTTKSPSTGRLSACWYCLAVETPQKASQMSIRSVVDEVSSITEGTARRRQQKNQKPQTTQEQESHSRTCPAQQLPSLRRTQQRRGRELQEQPDRPCTELRQQASDIVSSNTLKTKSVEKDGPVNVVEPHSKTTFRHVVRPHLARFEKTGLLAGSSAAQEALVQ